MMLYLSPSENFRLLDVFEDDFKRLEQSIIYRHGTNICWEIHVALIGRAKDFTNGKAVCLSGCGHPPTSEMSTPQMMMQYNVEYNEADLNRDFEAAQMAYSKSMPNEYNGKSAAGPWNWNKSGVDKALEQLPIRQPRKRKWSDDEDTWLVRDILIKPEPCLAGLSFVFEGQFLGQGQLWHDRSGHPAPPIELVRRYGGEVTLAPSTRTSYAVMGSGVELSKRQIIEESQVRTVTESGFLKLITPLIRSAKVPAQPPTKLPNGKELNYLIKVELDGTSFPAIHRVFSYPAHLSLYHFHLAIQIAFDWQRCGQWAFLGVNEQDQRTWPISTTEDEYMRRK